MELNLNMLYTKINQSALIGYTGFVGAHIKSNYSFTNYFNSRNINDFKKIKI